MDAMELVAFKVNGTEWRLRDVLKLACMEERFSAVEDSIRRAIMKEFAEQHQISIDEQEWKAKANELRQQLGLYSAAETLAWLKVRGLTMVDLFESAKARLLTEKVKRIASEDKVDAYYLKSRLSYDKAIISQLIVGCREQAQELLFQLEMIDAHPELRVYLLEQLADDAMRKFLKRTALFAPLHHQELRSLLDIMVMKEYAPGQAIVRDGEMGDAFYILRTGTASVLKESEGNRKLNIVKAGEFFGELGLLTGDPR
ncbi:MAG: cyclic nucleotide-binding domain-containing protein, partial [Candidatus Pristimantibacillus sp.]